MDEHALYWSLRIRRILASMSFASAGRRSPASMSQWIVLPPSSDSTFPRAFSTL